MRRNGMNVTIITVSEDEIHYEGLYPYETGEITLNECHYHY